MARTVPGNGAVVKANFDSNFGIASFTITNGGTGYASTDPPQISITGTTVPTSTASFYPIIQNGVITSIKILSPGAGYIPLVSLASTAVGIASVGRVGNNEDILGNDVVRSIYIKDPGFGYSQAPTVTIADPPLIAGTGDYIFNEIIEGSRSKLQARVKSWDKDTAVLKITNIGIGDTTAPAFYPGESIIGSESGASYVVQEYNPTDTYDKYSENDEFETLGDNLLDFTESNPFGTF